jgi:hypothetical protein
MSATSNAGSLVLAWLKPVCAKTRAKKIDRAFKTPPPVGYIEEYGGASVGCQEEKRTADPQLSRTCRDFDPDHVCFWKTADEGSPLASGSATK